MAGQGDTSTSKAAGKAAGGDGGGFSFDALWDRGVQSFGTADGLASRAFDALLRSPLLLEPAGRALSAGWQAQRLLRHRQREALRAAGVATADDLARAHAAALRIEGRLDDALAELRALRAEVAALRSPPWWSGAGVGAEQANDGQPAQGRAGDGEGCAGDGAAAGADRPPARRRGPRKEKE